MPAITVWCAGYFVPGVNAMRDFLKAHHAPISIVIAGLIALAAMLLMPSIETAGVMSMSAAGLLMSLMRFAVAVSLLFVVLRVLDMIGNFNWPEMSRAIQNDPRACALYFVGRLVAYGYIAGTIFS